ncbi:uncharacterized protein DEA37_0004044 [Paragonimus westermani]|uniref:Uncharacterized protein n=1 Tax=Paragonimus westermani TaxID=34504 RepID=A0A5J4P2M2_9TREM|nr:uncharacterized protein DEA37_0004044 [Paragonimus westermani]
MPSALSLAVCHASTQLRLSASVYSDDPPKDQFQELDSKVSVQRYFPAAAAGAVMYVWFTYRLSQKQTECTEVQSTSQLTTDQAAEANALAEQHKDDHC